VRACRMEACCEGEEKTTAKPFDLESEGNKSESSLSITVSAKCLGSTEITHRKLPNKHITIHISTCVIGRQF